MPSISGSSRLFIVRTILATCRWRIPTRAVRSRLSLVTIRVGRSWEERLILVGMACERSRPRMDLLELVHHFFMPPSVSETIHDSAFAIDRNRNGVHLPSDSVPAVSHSMDYESDARCNNVGNSQA